MSQSTLDDALRSYFGFDGFRPGQREACQAALAGRDALVVMPTGSGKSLCYQLPGLLSADLTIVVSPLVALMQDQVEALAARGVGDRVALVNAQQDAATNREVVRRAVEGQVGLLYVAPERFSSPAFAEQMAGARVGLFVVDEAHCVSQWGHDFRPEYFRLAEHARQLGAGSIMASTATATPRVALDIVKRLGLRDPVKVSTGFDRPNLSFSVARPPPHLKRPLLLEALRRPDALPAIVYAGTRAGAEDTASFISRELGVEALAYHAGLDRDRRASTQRRFLTDEVPVVVATNAFGMGVDKANVRTVVHVTVPSSLEAYYQEAGRGGRDGRPSLALLLAEGRDKALHVHFIKRDEMNDKVPAAVMQGLAQAAGEDGRFDVESRRLASAAGIGDDALRSLIGHLARAGLVDPSPGPPDRLAGRLRAALDPRAAGLVRTSAAEGVRIRWQQYRQIWAYVEGDACRRVALLRHFGDSSTPEPEVPCCDVCDASLSITPPPPDPMIIDNLDQAIIHVARAATPRVGRTTCAEILHGAKTKKIERNAYDGLPVYGCSSAMRRADILARIDELIDARRLTTTGGPYPVLALPGDS
ncbi:MAG: ATP-dependent helicase RecQ [Thermoleophilaceae bacterium]|jgi:ATP-dependent DNA helicase RecQ|nr:ATP-dependent helicase RecQ [Thermoleophilaceae bacterium]